jgi:hypothetical protein
MGFWDDLTGKSAQRDIRSANADASNAMAAGYDRAGNALASGYQRGQGQLGQGRNALADAYRQARDDASGGTSRAVSRLDAYGGQGGYQNASRMYGDALGANGGEAQQRFVQGFQGDPFRAQNEQFAQNALAKQYASRGMLNSGTAALASARASQERGSQDYNSYLDRLRAMAGDGASMASQAAGYEANGGNALASLASQYGGNVNNSYGQGAAYDVQQGGQTADMDYRYATDMAGNRINYGNAMASSRGIGVNNLIGLGGMAFNGLSKIPAVNKFLGG